ncbi:MAG: YceI family protein, partial [Streptosporangiaceae bacterium]
DPAGRQDRRTVARPLYSASERLRKPTRLRAPPGKRLKSQAKGTIDIAPDVAASSVRAAIDVGTLTTGNALRDEKILAPDVLDAARYPTIDFSSRALVETSPGRYAVHGDLTIHGITKPSTLDLTVHGVVTDTWNKSRLGLTATADIKRSDFAVLKFGHVPLVAGGFMVPDAVHVTIDIEATRDEPGDSAS